MPGYHCTAAFMPYHIRLRAMPEHFRTTIWQRCAMEGTVVPETIVGSLVLISTPSQKVEDYQILIREAPIDFPWDVPGAAMHAPGLLADCGHLFGGSFPDRGHRWWDLQDIAILAAELSSSQYGAIKVHYYFATWAGGVQTPEIYTIRCSAALNLVQRCGTPRGIGCPGSQDAIAMSSTGRTFAAGTSINTIEFPI